MHRQQKGFTLIELMIVVAIIGILASIALPSYQNYTIKTRVMEGIGLISPIKQAISIGLSTKSDLAGIASSWNSEANHNGGVATSKYVEKITLNPTSGLITVDYNGSTVGVIDEVNDKLEFMPFIRTIVGIEDLSTALAAGHSGSLDWVCASAEVVTATSRGVPVTAAPMGILAKYVPAECR